MEPLPSNLPEAERLYDSIQRAAVKLRAAIAVMKRLDAKDVWSEADEQRHHEAEVKMAEADNLVRWS